MAALIIGTTASWLAGPIRAQRPCSGVSADGPWTSVHSPFGERDGIVDFAVSAVDPGKLWITDGVEVSRTRDGGCTWETVFEVPETPNGGRPFARSTARVVALATAGESTVHLLVMATETPVLSAPFAFSSADEGDAWAMGQGLPPLVKGLNFSAHGRCGFPATCHLEVAPAHPDIAYLALDVPGVLPAPGVVYGSTDGGQTWEARGVPASPAEEAAGLPLYAGITILAVDPLEPERVWANLESPHSSDDGGRSWVRHPAPGRFWYVSLDIRHEAGRPPDVLATYAENLNRSVKLLNVVSSPDGENFEFQHPLTFGLADFHLDSLARIDTGRAVVVGAEGLRALDPSTGVFLPVHTRGRNGLENATAEPRPDGCFWFSSANRLERHCLPTGRRPVFVAQSSAEDLAACAEPAPARPASGQATLAAPTIVEVGTEGSAHFNAVLALSRVPAPVDVFFVLDTSPSMNPVINDLRRTIDEAAQTLAGTAIDLHVGLAEFNDRFSLPYRRLVPLGPLDCKLGRALDDIESGGGAEPHLEALAQALTGRGKVEVGVAPGQQADFRPGAASVIVHATDEEVMELEDGPDFAEVADWFKAKNVKHVGLHAVTGTPVQADGNSRVPAGPVRASLNRLSRESDTLAPAGGIDCDADGIVDLAERDPIVCSLGAVSTATAVGRPSVGTVVIAVVNALAKSSVVTLEAASESELKVEIESPNREADLREGARLDYRVKVDCPREPSSVNPVLVMTAKVAGRRIADATTEFRCPAAGQGVIGAEGVSSGNASLSGGTGVLIPIPPGPAVGPSASPAPSGAPSSAAAPTPGAVPVHGSERQVAKARNHSPMRDRRVSPTPTLAAGAAMAGAIGLVSVAHRRRTANRWK